MNDEKIPDAVKAIRHAIGSVNIESDATGDNLAIALCTYFEDHLDCPDEEEDDECGWKPWVSRMCDRALARIAQAAAKAAEPHPPRPQEQRDDPPPSTQLGQAKDIGIVVVSKRTGTRWEWTGAGWMRLPEPQAPVPHAGLNRYEATLADTRTWHERTVVYEATTLADATTMAQQQCAKGRWADGSPSEQVTHMRCLPAITATAEAFRYGMRNPEAVIAAVADALGRRHMEFAAIGERSTERYWRELAMAAVLAAGSAALARGDGAAS